jgi:hypothetical protein
VQRPRDQFFAGAAFTSNQHRRLGGRQLAQQFAQFTDRFAVTQQLVLGLINVNRTLPSQPRHAKGPTQSDLNPGDVKWQGMKIEKPLAHEIADILQSQDFLVQYGDPLSATATDQFFDGIWPVKM